MPLFKFVKKVFGEFGQDKGSQLSAAFAYTSIFALAPLLIVVISIAGLIFGQRAVEGTLFNNISDIVGPNTAHTIQHAIAHVQQSGHNILALVAGSVGTILAAAALTNQLQNAFDVVFSIVPDPAGGFKRMIYIKLKNASTLIIGSLVVAASVAATALLAAAGSSLSNRLGMPKATLQVINVIGSLVVFLVIFNLIYRVLPDVRLPKKVVFWGSAIVALMFLIGKIILGWVIGHNGTASAYGAAASLITLLLWFYYTGQILVLGAEGMKVYVHNRGLDYKPKRYTLKQKTINIKAKNDLRGRALERFARGFTRKVRGEK